MANTVQEMAAEIAGQLEPLIDTFLVESDLHNKQNLGIAIWDVLWDNKVGILRALQALAHGQQAGPEVK